MAHAAAYARRSFRTYFLCAYIPLVVLAAVLLATSFDRNRAEYERGLAEIAVRDAQFAVERLNVITDSAISIFSERWYRHYNLADTLYADEFDYQSRLEISAGIVRRLIAMEIVDDILVVTPSRGEVINRLFMYSIKDYADFFHQVDILEDAASGTTVILPADNSVCVIVLRDPNALPQASMVALLVSKLKFASFFRYDGRAIYARVLLGGETLYEVGKAEGGVLFESEHSAFCGKVSFAFAYPTYWSVQRADHARDALMWLALLCLVSLAVASMLSQRFTRPVRALLDYIDPLGDARASLDDMCRMLGDYVDGIADHNQRLGECNKDMRERLSRFFVSMREDILFLMIANPDFDYRDEYIASEFPWICAGFPLVLIMVRLSGEAESGDLLVLPPDFAKYQTTIRAFRDELLAVAWFGDEQEAQNKLAMLAEMCEDHTSEHCVYLISELLHDVRELHDAYLALKRAADFALEDLLTVPISLQVRFASVLRGGDADEFEAALREARTAFSTAQFALLLKRLARENGAHGDLIAKLPASPGWPLARKAALALYDAARTSRERRSNETAQLLEHYIDENYRDPDMSVKQLSAMFHMDGARISRLFKGGNGATFTEYLLEKRMTEALRLVDQTKLSASAIAQTVGYLNYITFKRAFVRYYGISPRERREGKACGARADAQNGEDQEEMDDETGGSDAEDV